MTQKEAVLVATSLFEQRLAVLGCPAVVIVGLTESAEFVRLAKGLDQDHNRKVLVDQFDQLLAQESAKKEPVKPLFTIPRVRECPICLGGGKAIGDSELTAAPCDMCEGTGRVPV